MIGDHFQLPPVIKNMAFQKFSNMEQSLFTRLVRLGVPVVQLDGQGRARASICDLYKWRYKKLDNLKHILEWPEYLRANGGFVHDYQLINVENFNGVGESEPTAFFYQNLAEAEYIVAVYMYMRLIGYPAEKISILTTYNGQKNLIRDVVNSRCTDNPLVGRPHKVTTVDKYQGQQNDFVLISLVRTKNVGHLRDVRRLVVAASRARLGLYIFGRVSLFKNCFELQPTFKLLMARPQKLQLVKDELFSTERKASQKVKPKEIVEIEDMPAMAQFAHKIYMEKFEVFKSDFEKKRQEIYASLPKEEAKEDESAAEKKTQKKIDPKAPFVPIPIENEIDEEVLTYSGELQEPANKKSKDDDGEEEQNDAEETKDEVEVATAAAESSETPETE